MLGVLIVTERIPSRNTFKLSRMIRMNVFWKKINFTIGLLSKSRFCSLFSKLWQFWKKIDDLWDKKPDMVTLSRKNKNKNMKIFVNEVHGKKSVIYKEKVYRSLISAAKLFVKIWNYLILSVWKSANVVNTNDRSGTSWHHNLPSKYILKNLNFSQGQCTI